MAKSILVHKCGRGFESHFWHIFFHIPLNCHFEFKKIKKSVATAGNRTPINCLEGNYANHYTTVAVANGSTDIQNASSLTCLRTKWQWWASQTTVRMAEWSKAPDSRMWSFHHHSGWGLSGPHMWAWVRIPLLTHLFLTFLYIVYFIKKSHVRQRGIEPRSTAWKATMLTITPLSQLITACQTSNVFLVFQNRLCSHLHTADIPFTYSNHSPVAITKFFESDVGKQKKNRTHLC